MTKLKKQFDIFSYGDLQRERQKLKQTIQKQEESFKENPVVKIANSFNKSSSVSSSMKEAFSGLNFQTGEALISSLLLSIKKTRKYYLAYIVAKEMIPFTIKKVKDIMKSKHSETKNLKYEENNHT
jgi:uncharacterized phage infection (PIP) family protein YhgE